MATKITKIDFQDFIDHTYSSATNEVALQVIYSSITDPSEKAVVGTDNNAEAMSVVNSYAKMHASAALDSEQIRDTPIVDYISHLNIFSNLENKEPDAPIEILYSDSDQAIFTPDETVADVNEESEVNVSESVWFMHSESIFTMVWLEPATYISESIFTMDWLEPATYVTEGSVYDTSTDTILTDEVDNSEQPVGDLAAPVDFIPIEDTVIEEPVIIDDTSHYEEFIIINDEYNPDEIAEYNYELLTDPVTEEDQISQGLVEAEEYTYSQIDDSMEESYVDYETQNGDLVDEDNYFVDDAVDPFALWTEVDPDSYLIDEPVDSNTDLSPEISEVTDESFFIYSYVTCWTTNFSIKLDYQDISLTEVILISDSDLTINNTSLELQSGTGGYIDAVNPSDIDLPIRNAAIELQGGYIEITAVGSVDLATLGLPASENNLLTLA